MQLVLYFVKLRRPLSRAKRINVRQGVGLLISSAKVKQGIASRATPFTTRHEVLCEKYKLQSCIVVIATMI